MALGSVVDLMLSPTLTRLDACGTESLDGSETTENHEFDGVRENGSIDRPKTMAKPIDWRGRRAVAPTLLETTGHDKGKAALFEREARLRAIMDNAQAEICRTDGDGSYLHIDQRYKDLWGVKDEEVRGELAGDIPSPRRPLRSPRRATWPCCKATAPWSVGKSSFWRAASGLCP